MRKVIDLDHRYQLLLRNCDCISSRALDESIEALGISVLRIRLSLPEDECDQQTCDRNVAQGVSRLASAAFLRACLRHYDLGRPHMALEPGIADRPLAAIPKSASRRRRGVSYAVKAELILCGLRHEYRPVAA
jgi:hypothetical protein